MFILEYSPSQGAFHVDYISRAAKLNRGIIEEGRTPEFFLVAASEDRTVLDAMVDKYRHRWGCNRG